MKKNKNNKAREAQEAVETETQDAIALAGAADTLSGLKHLAQGAGRCINALVENDLSQLSTEELDEQLGLLRMEREKEKAAPDIKVLEYNVHRLKLLTPIAAHTSATYVAGTRDTPSVELIRFHGELCWRIGGVHILPFNNAVEFVPGAP